MTVTGRRGRRNRRWKSRARSTRCGVALLRITVGIIFLWAGLEKLLAPAAFDAGGFLKFATAGTLGWPFVSGEVAEGTVFNPTQGLWLGLADNATAMSIINVLVPLGQIGIGVSLILGLFTRFGAAMGALMMTFFFFAAWDFAYGIVNQHLAYALICVALVGPRRRPLLRPRRRVRRQRTGWPPALPDVRESRATA